jgi:hypothetical protein
MSAVETEAVAWVNVAGLLLDLAGAAVLAWGLFIDEDEALRLGQSYYSETREEGLQLPPVKDRLRQSDRAKLGLLLLAVGVVLQIVANSPTDP